MILKCECVNSSADMLYGKGYRPHSALMTFRDRPGRQVATPQQEEYCCDYCSYVRTKARGLRTGEKE